MPRRVLLAGCGDLGIRLAARLLARGDRVFGLRRQVALLPAGIEPVAADLNDPDSLRGLPASLDAVVCTLTPGSRDAEGYRRAYIEAPAHLLAALQTQQPRWIFASSTAVYGGDQGVSVDDDTLPDPQAFNGELLLEAELALARRVHALQVLRFSGIYGPGRERMLAKSRSCRTAEPRWTNRIHADDAAAALEFALDHPQLQGACIASDGSPALEHEVLAYLAAAQGLPEPARAPGPERGRRILPKRLFAAGFAPQHPDFRSGYSALLQAAR